MAIKFNYKPAWQAFVLRFLRGVFVMSRIVPFPLLLAVGSAMGALAFRLSSRYRKVAIKNLTIAYGDRISPAEKMRITREVFINFAKSSMEFPVVARMSASAVASLCELRDDDKALIASLLARGKGLVAFSAHLGNFELMARRFVDAGFKFTVVVRNDNNKAVAEMLNNIRRSSGYGIIGRGETVKLLLRKLRSGENEVIGMLPDQKSDDLFVPFFGVLAGTVAGPAVVALRTESPILPMFCVRLPGDKHKIVLGTPIIPTATEDKEADVERIMTQVNLEIEKIVREYPEQWLWLHDRWRVKPPAEVAARWEAQKTAAQCAQQQQKQPTSAAC